MHLLFLGRLVTVMLVFNGFFVLIALQITSCPICDKADKCAFKN